MIFAEHSLHQCQPTILNHFRDDYSTYHLVDYDPKPEQCAQADSAGFSGRFFLEPWTGMGLYSYNEDVPPDGLSELSVASGHIADMLLRLYLPTYSLLGL